MNRQFQQNGMETAIPSGTDIVKDAVIVAQDKIKGFDSLGGLSPAGKTLAITGQDRPVFICRIFFRRLSSAWGKNRAHRQQDKEKTTEEIPAARASLEISLIYKHSCLPPWRTA